MAVITLCAAVTGCLSACSDDVDGGRSKQPLACGAEIDEHEIESTKHVLGCSAVTYQTNPPSSGNHYPIWGAFGVYDAPLPRGFWVHNLEHGAVVVTYHCDDGCDDDIANAKAWVESAPAEASCTDGPRLLLIPDPLLDTKWAASAWGVTMRANCFDKATFEAFYENHRGHGPEDICSPGEDFRNSDGTLNLPADCGK
jgi:hypothetical protein